MRIHQFIKYFFILILELFLGGEIYFLASRKTGSTPTIITESSPAIVESIRKVFKVASAEVYFN
jgi:hypothetical protein